MAVTVSQIFLGANIQINDIIATADADVAATIPSKLGAGGTNGSSAIPSEVYLTPMLSQALTALSGWSFNWQSTPTLNYSLVKLASTGSGNAAVQLRAIFKSVQAPNAVVGGTAVPLQPLGL